MDNDEVMDLQLFFLRGGYCDLYENSLYNECEQCNSIYSGLILVETVRTFKDYMDLHISRHITGRKTIETHYNYYPLEDFILGDKHYHLIMTDECELFVAKNKD